MSGSRAYAHGPRPSAGAFPTVAFSFFLIVGDDEHAHLRDGAPPSRSLPLQRPQHRHARSNDSNRYMRELCYRVGHLSEVTTHDCVLSRLAPALGSSRGNRPSSHSRNRSRNRLTHPASRAVFASVTRACHRPSGCVFSKPESSTIAPCLSRVSN